MVDRIKVIKANWKVIYEWDRTENGYWQKIMGLGNLDTL